MKTSEFLKTKRGKSSHPGPTLLHCIDVPETSSSPRLDRAPRFTFMLSQPTVVPYVTFQAPKDTVRPHPQGMPRCPSPTAYQDIGVLSEFLE